jgi:hypothetical protein
VAKNGVKLAVIVAEKALVQRCFCLPEQGSSRKILAQ